MRLSSLILLGPVVFLLGACALGPQILAGDSDTVSITAQPWDDVDAAATRYCQGFGKQAQALGNGPLGPDTTRRLFDYNCVAPGEPVN